MTASVAGGVYITTGRHRLCDPLNANYRKVDALPITH